MVDKNDLGSISLFDSLEDSERETILKSMEMKTFYKGSLVFPEDEAGGTLYIIKSGEVVLSHLIREGEKKVLATLGAGGYFGDVSLLDGKEHPSTAEVVSDSVVLMLSKEKFDAFSAEFPKAGFKVLKEIVTSLCSLVRTMDEKFIDMVQYVTLDR